MDKQKNLGRGVLSNVFANGILQFLNYAFPVLTLPFLGSAIGLEEFGVVNFFSVLVGYFTLFVIYGFDASATRKVPELEGDLKKMNLLIEGKKKSEALKFLPKLNSELMKIAKSGIVKKQNASRNVSRITKKISLI